MKSTRPADSRFLLPAQAFVPRWKWMAGSAAALTGAALTTDADAGVVQITLGTQASNTNGGLPTSDISPDLTGDGIEDLLDASAYGFRQNGSTIINRLDLRTSGGVLARASVSVTSSIFYFYRVNINGGGATASTAQNFSQLVPITFTDKRINGNVATEGWLEINARNASSFVQRITLVRLVFDDASTARPGGINTGGNEPEWVDPTPAQRRAIQKQIRKFTKKLRVAARKGQKAKIKKFRKKLRQLKKQLRQL